MHSRSPARSIPPKYRNTQAPSTHIAAMSHKPSDGSAHSEYICHVHEPLAHSSSYERSSIERRHTTQARRADSASPPHHRSICSNSASVEHSDDCLWLRKHPRLIRASTQHTRHSSLTVHPAHAGHSPRRSGGARLKRASRLRPALVPHVAHSKCGTACGTARSCWPKSAPHKGGADELRATAHDEAGAAAPSRGAANGPRRTGSPSVEPSNLTVERRRRTTRALGCRTPAHHGLTRVNTGLGAGAPRSMPPGDLRLQRWRSRIKGIHQGAVAPWLDPRKACRG